MGEFGRTPESCLLWLHSFRDAYLKRMLGYIIEIREVRTSTDDPPAWPGGFALLAALNAQQRDE